MNFFEAIQSGFSNYVNFKGRAIRSEHNYWVLFVIIIGIISVILDSMAGYEDWGDLSIDSISSLILLLPNLSVKVRRFHDINKSGWNYFWCITIIGIIPVIYWLYFKEGDKKENFYGSNILGETLEDKKNDIDFNNISILEKLAKLKEQGHLTEEEYNEKKKNLL